MSTRVDNLIKDIKNAKDPLIGNLEEIRVIIGNGDYTLQSGIQNIAVAGITIYGGFQNVAFLCDTKNLNLVSIVALLLDSWDDAIELIDRIIKKPELMKQIAKYLATKRIILVDQKGNESALNIFFSQHINHKVLFVGDKLKEDYHILVKNYIWIPHCSGQTYGTNLGNAMRRILTIHIVVIQITAITYQ